MDKELKNLKEEIFIKDNTKMENLMDTESIAGKMEAIIKAISSKEFVADTAYGRKEWVIATNMKDSF
jgi:hypothetical protein